MNFRNHYTLAFVVLNSLLTYTNAQFRIVNGNPSDIKDSPYLVAIYRNSKYDCVGSLVSVKLVVSVAQCFKKYSHKDFTLIAGVTNLNDEEAQRRFVKDISYPYCYDAKTYKNDVAVIKVCEAFNESPTVKPIELCNPKLKAGTELQVSGWGSTIPGRTSKETELRTIDVPIMPRHECVSRLKGMQVTKSIICAEHEERGVSFGDGGAPGVVNGNLCAMAVSGASENLPQLYTDVCNVKILSFIKRHMKKR